MRLFYSESNLGRLDYWDENQVLIGGIQPNMILGMLLGADFVSQDDKDADITPRCLGGKDLCELPEPEDLLDHDLIRIFGEQIRSVLNNSENRLRPIPPFFWDSSGRAAIHGVLTSAQKFLGETVFMDMMTDPQACLDIMNRIGDSYVVLCRHFSQTGELPISEIHVGECSSCMVGPELIERFVAPATSEIGRQLGPIRLHSCGPSTNHLQAFSKIEGLQSLDLGGDSSVARARELFGKAIPISIAPLPQDMSDESSEGILNWAERILEENGDGNLEYVYHLEPGYNADNIRALTEFVS
jgi:hypothetical protein